MSNIVHTTIAYASKIWGGLATAAELIRKTSKPLAEVALAVGFSDQRHFTRVFTQMTGETEAP
jgi:transcriptional regulator GlxA family with amidase domain